MAISRVYPTALHSDPTWKLHNLCYPQGLNTARERNQDGSKILNEQHPGSNTRLALCQQARKKECWKYISHVDLLCFIIQQSSLSSQHLGEIYMSDSVLFPPISFAFFTYNKIDQFLSMTCKKIILLDPLHIRFSPCPPKVFMSFVILKIVILFGKMKT